MYVKKIEVELGPFEAFRLGEPWPEWFSEQVAQGGATVVNRKDEFGGGPDYAILHQLCPSDDITVRRGGWIINGSDLKACEPEIFTMLYKEVDSKC